MTTDDQQSGELLADFADVCKHADASDEPLTEMLRNASAALDADDVFGAKLFLHGARLAHSSEVLRRPLPDARQPYEGADREHRLTDEQIIETIGCIRRNVEEIPDWKDSGPLITIHCHAEVLLEDVPPALALPPRQEAPRSEDMAAQGCGTTGSSARGMAETTPAALCGDCPPVGYVTDATRCSPCPRRDSGTASAEGEAS